MKNKDQELIWESYRSNLNEGTDGSTHDLTPREKVLFIKHAREMAEQEFLERMKEADAGPANDIRKHDPSWNDPELAINEGQDGSAQEEILQFINELEQLMPQVDVNWQVDNGNQTGVTPERANNPRTWAGLKDFLEEVWRDEEYAAEFGLQGASWENREAEYLPGEQLLYTFFNDSHKAPGRSKGITSDFVNRLIKVNAGLPDRLEKFYGELKLTEEMKEMFKSQTHVRFYIKPESEQIQARNTAVSREINRWRHD